MTYEQWAKLNPVYVPEPHTETCGSCDGEGQHACTCGHRHPCPECDGKGEIVVDDGPDILFEHRVQYEMEVREAKKKLADWGIAV
jgi:DnaJ-class molecular chaperone